jgi:hypothetical protein
MNHAIWQFTIVTVPFPFKDSDGVRQRSAIQSWMRLEPKPEIILMGSDEGVPEYAQGHGLRHIPNLARNRLGDLDCGDILAKAQKAATHRDILYMDCDVVLLPIFTKAFRYVAKKYSPYKLVSGRWDIPTPESDLTFEPGWVGRISEQIYRHHEKGTDFHAFPKGLYDKVPDFSIGLGAWDGWMIWYAAQRGATVVRMDAFKAALHLKHGRRWVTRPGKGRNQQLAGRNKMWVVNATVNLKPKDIR